MIEAELIPINLILRDENQPRKMFNDEELEELADSIKQHGLLQPLLVTPVKDEGFRLVCGERRLRACTLLGKKEVPVEIRNLDEHQVLEIQLVENLQRENLNPIEEAEAFQKMIAQSGYTHEGLAQKIGKSREYVSNKLRLLKLPENVKRELTQGTITEGHARLLLSLEKEKQQETLSHIVDNKLSVGDLQTLVHRDVSHETLESESNRTFLVEIPSDVFAIVQSASKERRIKPDELIAQAVLSFTQKEVKE